MTSDQKSRSGRLLVSLREDMTVAMGTNHLLPEVRAGTET